MIADDALAARLAGLVAEERETPNEAASTRVVVTGLVSVASIAGFKRNLVTRRWRAFCRRVVRPGWRVRLRRDPRPRPRPGDGIATLPGFGARVTNEAPGELTVAARDPESEG